jgi:hypothetical protein
MSERRELGERRLNTHQLIALLCVERPTKNSGWDFWFFVWLIDGLRQESIAAWVIFIFYWCLYSIDLFIYLFRKFVPVFDSHKLTLFLLSSHLTCPKTGWSSLFVCRERHKIMHMSSGLTFKDLKYVSRLAKRKQHKFHNMFKITKTAFLNIYTH